MFNKMLGCHPATWGLDSCTESLSQCEVIFQVGGHGVGPEASPLPPPWWLLQVTEGICLWPAGPSALHQWRALSHPPNPWSSSTVYSAKALEGTAMISVKDPSSLSKCFFWSNYYLLVFLLFLNPALSCEVDRDYECSLTTTPAPNSQTHNFTYWQFQEVHRLLVPTR